MTSQPPFFVHGHDGKEYPADADTLARWVSDGTVKPDQMVFVWGEHRWTRVRDLPQFTSAPAPRPITGSRRYVVPIIGIGCLGVIVILAFLGVLGWREHGREEQQRAEQRAKIRRERHQVEVQLRQSAPAAARTIHDRLAAVASAERADDVATVDAGLREIQGIVEPYLSLKPTPSVLTAPISDYRGYIERATQRAELRKEYDAIAAKKRSAEALIAQRSWIDADKALDEALSSVEKLQNQRDVSRLIPSFAPSDEKAAIQKQRRRISKQVDRQRHEVEQQTILAALCGPKPFCSAWDGECGNIESALKRVAHDPGSIDVENCTDPVLYRDRCWVTTCDVRGKNAFGALVLDRKRFSISKLGVEQID